MNIVASAAVRASPWGLILLKKYSPRMPQAATTAKPMLAAGVRISAAAPRLNTMNMASPDSPPSMTSRAVPQTTISNVSPTAACRRNP